MILYLKLLGIAMIPVVLSVFFRLLEDRTGFAKLGYAARQIIIGVVFGAAAVFGTEYGVEFHGALVNARDAAPLCAGLIFGGPAGIIAGCIGGIERWFAVYWGIGTFTRVACTISTILAGFYAAVLRRFMFDNRKPTIIISLCIGVVMEIFHMTMVFVTNMNDPDRAYEVLRVSTGPMVFANAFSVMLAVLLCTVLFGEWKQTMEERERLTHKMQWRMLITILAVFFITTIFTFALQTGMARNQSKALLEMNLDDVQNEITAASDDSLLRIARMAASEMGMDMKTVPLNAKARRYNFSEINVVDENGIIIASTDPSLEGFDMHSGAQAAEFLCLLEGTESYVQSFQPISLNSDVSRKYAGIALRGGFLQFGYDKDRFHEDMSDQVLNITVNRHIGETGFLLIINSDNEIVSEPEGKSLGKVVGMDVAQELRDLDISEYERFETLIKGEPYYCMYTTREGYYIFAMQSVSEANHSRNVGLFVNSYMTILIFATLYAMIYWIIRRLVVKNIRSVNRSLGQITEGNLDERVDVRGTTEFSSLSDDINSTVDTLKHYIAEASARIDAELEFARKIQSSALPGVFPPFPSRTEIDLYANMNAAKEVGGDFYDYYWMGENRLAFLIADVSGKGIPGAMFMMNAKSVIKSFAESGLSVEEIFTHANERLCEGNDADMFVTAWMGILDVSTGHVEFANAGHNPPLIRRPDGSFEYLRSKAGFVLAGMDGVRYKKQEFDLEPGSTFFAYTDGVTEATDTHKELYGEDRLQACLDAHVDQDMRGLCDSLKTDIDAFVGEAPQFDDITMLALKFNHFAGGAHERTEA